MTLSEELQWRGFVNQSTLKNLSELDEKKLSFYHGYDASVDSLTIGNLAAVMMDKVFIKHGCHPVILSGGATSLIGDPGGKDTERNLQASDKVASNVAAVTKQVKALFGVDVTFVNNLDWYSKMNTLDFLRDVGKHFSMTPLVQRDYIAKRIGEGGKGISYTEFSYTLLQGYDFLYLNQKYDVTLQLAGSDQWGNSLSGVDLIRRVSNKGVHVLTCPLIINKATGKKFGKSEEGAIWLDRNKTSVYKFYQFWLNVDDDGVQEYLKIYTELEKNKIDTIIKQFDNNRASRIAQKTLAYEVTKLVHGKEATESVQRVTDVLFGTESYQTLQKADILALTQELPITKSQIGKSILQSLVSGGIFKSNSEAYRALTQGSIYLNGIKLNEDGLWQKQNTIDGQHIIVRRGKNNNALVQL